MNTDTAFIQAVEQCAFPVADFHHKEHVRLAWLYLRMEPYPQALDRMIATIRRVAGHAGVPEKFHYTMTVAWMRLVDSAMVTHPSASDFDSLITANPSLLSVKALEEFYSPGRIHSAEAKSHMVDPDLKPLP